MRRPEVGEASQFRLSRYLFALTFALATAVTVLPGGAANVRYWTVAAAILIMALYLLASWIWTPAVLRQEDFGDSFYFLGFLLTLVALVATLVGLGEVEDERVQEVVLSRFGLALATTIFGLAVRTTLRMFKERAEASLLDDVARSQEALRRAAEELRVVLQNATTDMATTLGTASNRIDTAVGHLTGRLKVLSDGIDRAGQSLGPWAASVEAARGQTEALSEGMGAAGAQSGTLSRRLSELGTSLSAMDAPIGHSTEGLNRFSTAAAAAADQASKLREISQAIEGSFGTLTTLVESLGTLPDLSAALDQLSRSIEAGKTSMAGLSESAGVSGAAIEGLGRQMSAVSLHGLEELSAVAESQARRLEDALGHWREALEQLDTVTKQLGRKQEEAAQSLKAVQGELTAGVEYLARIVSGGQA